MIIGKIHPGSGLGDQVFSYIVTRIIALDKGYDFGFVGKEFFKGKGFMNLDWGKKTKLEYAVDYPEGKLQVFTTKVFVFDKPYYDPEVNFIEDGTIIDGTGAQDERYWGHRLDEIREWLVNPNWPVGKPSENEKPVCMISYRGGEYKYVPELYLPKDYWIEAMDRMVKKCPDIAFQVHTDDVEEARKVFGSKAAIMPNDIQLNWMCIRHAQYLIISNSAFAIIPALLNENVKEVIAPRAWANYNAHNGIWLRPQNFYFCFTYI